MKTDLQTDLDLDENSQDNHYKLKKKRFKQN